LTKHGSVIGQSTRALRGMAGYSSRMGFDGTARRLFVLKSLISALLVLMLAGQAAFAQGRPMSFIRDAEIEQLLREYLDPLLGVAGLRKGFIKVVIVGDRGFNAFVADGKRVFINAGALMDSTTPNQVIGVLAHETGHIAGGHLARLRQELEKAQIIAVIGTVLGGAAAIGGMSTGRVGNDGVGAMGALLGGSEMARRSLLAYQRGEEQAADRAAVRLLNETRQSTKGMVETFERFSNDMMFSSARLDKYLLSHPLPQERIAALKELAITSPFYEVKDPPARQQRHDMMRAKLFAFIGGQAEVNRRYPLSNTSLPARYARAIVDYRFGRPDAAIRAIDALIAEQPGNPYFHELKGQALLEAGRANEALQPLRRAVALAPNQPLLKVMLGHALVATDNPQNVTEAIRELTNALQRDPDAFEGYRYLSQAYARKGDEGNAALTSARGALITGEFYEAQRFARRALPLLPPGSPGAIAAREIADAKPEQTR
jgi:predicted Zn-dependent protease